MCLLHQLWELSFEGRQLLPFARVWTVCRRLIFVKSFLSSSSVCEFLLRCFGYYCALLVYERYGGLYKMVRLMTRASRKFLFDVKAHLSSGPVDLSLFLVSTWPRRFSFNPAFRKTLSISVRLLFDKSRPGKHRRLYCSNCFSFTIRCTLILHPTIWSVNWKTFVLFLYNYFLISGSKPYILCSGNLHCDLLDRFCKLGRETLPQYPPSQVTYPW